ncbi:MAG: hypothetical protein MEP57_04630 [Microvirga sp.]|nr:hypothetical protein [Microvirga sp.]
MLRTPAPEFRPLPTAATTRIAQAETERAERPNTISIPDPTRTSVFVGKAAPMGFTLPGASGPPSVYVFGNIDTLTPGSATAGNPGLFVGIPLSETGVNAASISAALSTAIGGGATTDLLAGQLLRQYRQIEQTLKSDRFRSVLPPGVKVIPQIVMTIPSHELAGLMTGGVEAAPNASLGIGMTVVAGAEKKGGPAGDGVAFFANSRILVNEALEAARRGEDLPTSRNFNFGVTGLNVPIPRTSQTANVGVGTGIRTDNFDPNAPWRVRLGDGTEADLPAPLAMIMNGLTGANSPINLQQTDLSEFANRLGVSPEALSRAAEAGESAFSVAGWGLEAAGVASAAKLHPLLGILAGLGLVGRGVGAIEDWSNEQLAGAMVARGMHDPSVALEGLLPELRSTDEVTHMGHVLGLTVDHAIRSGASSPEALLQTWTEAAEKPWSTSDRVGAQRVMLSNLVIGEFEKAGEIATALGDPIPDYSGEGLAVALRGVGSTELMQLRLLGREARRDEVVDATGPDGEWRKIRLTARDDENGGLYYVALKHSDNSQHYELPESVRNDRQASIDHVRRALASGQMSDSFVADPPRGTISEIIQLPPEEGEANRARLDALFERWKTANPNASLVVIGDYLVDRYNEAGVGEEEKRNIGVLYHRPELAPARVLFSTMFRSGEDRISLPAGAEGDEGVLQARQIANAFSLQRERLGEAEYGRRIRETAVALHEAGWPLNFGVPELGAALGQVERERGAPRLAPEFNANVHRYRP